VFDRIQENSTFITRSCAECFSQSEVCQNLLRGLVGKPHSLLVSSDSPDPGHDCRWLGVDHVYLTENDPTGRPMKAAIQDFIDEGFVSFDVQQRPQAQLRVYAKCVQGYSHLYNWMAFFDLDEFLVLRDQYAPRLHCS
jgi:hypothetical protein